MIPRTSHLTPQDWSIEVLAVAQFTTLSLSVAAGFPALVVDGVSITACAQNPLSQASGQSVALHWSGLPTAAQYIAYYQWALVTGPAPKTTVCFT